MLLLFFIKYEISDSFVNHFDGPFAYLKTLDFYFKFMHRPVDSIFVLKNSPLCA